MQHRNPYRWWNIAAVIAVIAVNAMATLLPLNGKTTGELSDQYPVLITPAGYAFSIWSLIYLLLIGFAIYQARPRASRLPTVSQIGPWFLLSSLFNMAWIFAWHYEYVTASVFIMLALLITLIVLYTRVVTATSKPTTGERFLVQLPFRIYLGWICVATIVNISVALYKAGWNGFGLSEVTWTIILLIFGTLLVFVMGTRYADPYFMLVFVWAYVAIAYKQQDYSAVSTTALISAVLILIYAIGIALRKVRALKLR
ncbi:hypothetical protein FHS18_005057 [Paenibacillus phyllosphaerae]|uniref:Tryptophan-rich sensory protein n=1 Tax=Paenibacillus phyllosphaerae TaxID=274593 RepID=A0A7W5B1Y9_9BACL|nr:tryptophan-rich sensory protein [Paenibacillus phyllosphaerae]MBB3112955.1 hypothetical protein [Paenibacillus phyllosphaerae]